jgi:hypothetical protein
MKKMFGFPGVYIIILSIILFYSCKKEKPPVPDSTTTAATSITNTSATLNCTVNANNLSTAAYFEYGLTTSFGSTADAVPGTIKGNTPTSASALVTGLSAGNIYHYRVKAVSNGGTSYALI